MAAGGRFGDAAGGRSSRQRPPMGGRSAPPLRPPRGRSLSSRGGFSAARAAMTRCAHGRLANFCARGEQWMRLASCVNATVGGVWPLQPCCSGRRRWRVAADRPGHSDRARETLRVASSASRCSGGKVRPSIWKIACLRARSERILCEMGPHNPVLYVGTKTPGLPGFS